MIQGAGDRRSVALKRTVWLLVVFFLFASGCKEDWSSRMGLRPLWRNIAEPFEPYPLDRLEEELAADPPRFAFAVLGNTELTGPEEGEAGDGGIPGRIMDRVRAMRPQPEFIIHLGDIAASPEDSRAWREWIRTAHPFTPGPLPEGASLGGGKRCFALPGETDVDDGKTKAAFLARFPPPGGELPFSFDLEDFHFVGLDSEETDESWLMRYFGYNRRNNRIAGDQLEWLEQDLARNSGRRIVVFIHKPMFSPPFSSREGYGLDQHYGDRERLLALLEAHSVCAVFTGHEPVFHWVRISGIHHIITGGGGMEPKAPRWMGGFHHFLYVTIDEASRMDVYCLDPEEGTVEERVQVSQEK